MARFPSLVSLAVLTIAHAAHAENPPAPPKPAPALLEAFKGMEGTWACTGSMDNPTKPGTQLAMKSEMKIASELDGFAYSGSLKMEKNAMMPAGSKAHFHWGYDTAKQRLIEFGFDNGGNSWSGTSDGLKNGSVVWVEEGAMMGQTAKSRTTVTIKSPQEITVVGEQDDKGAWRKTEEIHCKKK